MDENLKDMILYSSGLEGFFSDSTKFLGLRVQKERTELLKALEAFSLKIALHIKAEEFREIIEAIETKELSVEVVRDFERIKNSKMMGKKCVPINIETLQHFADLSTWELCKNCDHKKKKCKLKTSFKKINDFGIYAPCQADEFEKGRE